MNAVYVLWIRQLKRTFRSRSRVIGSLGQPLLFLVAMGFGFGPIYRKAGGGDYIEFLTPGIVAMSILFTAVFSGIEIIWDRQFGFLKETLVAPVPRLAIMAGRALGGATVAVAQGIIVFFCSLAVGFRPGSAAGLALALVFMLLIALVFAGVGTAIASVLDDMHGFQLIMNFLVMPIFFFSGAMFPLDGLPGPLRWLAAANPLSYGVDGLHGALAGVYRYGPASDLAALAATAALTLGAGSWLFSRMEA
jgi:ABC-2 type transport system permease protein